MLVVHIGSVMRYLLQPTVTHGTTPVHIHVHMYSPHSTSTYTYCNSPHVYSPRGVARMWQGEGQEFFFQILKFACGEAPCALLGGFGGMPPEIFFKWFNLVCIWIRFSFLKK